jgi:hypothetical protein
VTDFVPFSTFFDPFIAAVSRQPDAVGGPGRARPLVPFPSAMALAIVIFEMTTRW